MYESSTNERISAKTDKDIVKEAKHSRDNRPESVNNKKLGGTNQQLSGNWQLKERSQ